MMKSFNSAYQVADLNFPVFFVSSPICPLRNPLLKNNLPVQVIPAHTEIDSCDQKKKNLVLPPKESGWVLDHRYLMNAV